MGHRFKWTAKSIKLIKKNIGNYLHNIGEGEDFLESTQEVFNYKMRK